jgi:hypothetical protein
LTILAFALARVCALTAAISMHFMSLDEVREQLERAGSKAGSPAFRRT